MKNPYEVLGVQENASKEEIDKAYRNLAGKYNPEHFIGSPLEADAKNKMDELNEAYDKIATSQDGPKIVTTVYPDSYSNSNFKDIRDLINQGDFAQARNLLNAMQLDRIENPEWSFLYGSVLNSTGYQDQAAIFFERAYNKEPANPEYSAVYNRINSQKSGQVNSNPYPEIRVEKRGCSSCDVCCGLMAVDCCCEAMGGDCIACC